jgi:hypothetical protein
VEWQKGRCDRGLRGFLDPDADVDLAFVVIGAGAAL